MCRFLVYKGRNDILLSKLITEPSHSILTQSYDCRLRLDTRRPVNGDGFGVGFYTSPELGPEPCIFTSTLPAWNCDNLERIASKTCSSLVFAHVRATTEGSLAENNCHPFQHNTLMWMHNGNLGGWYHIKRPLGDSLANKWYLGVKGGTDSEWAFALFLDLMEKEGVDPSSAPEGGFGPELLRGVMTKTIRKINEFIAAIPKEYAMTDLEVRSLLNFAVTDGHSVICTRYVSSKTDEAASLYFSSGTKWKEGKVKGDFKMERHDKGADIVLVASEPLTFERHNWVTVPTNSILTIHKQNVLIHPIIDEFYDGDPNHDRSSGFAVSKGLVSKAPGTTVAPEGEGVPRVNGAANTIITACGARREIDSPSLEMHRNAGGVALPS
ncbi:glucosamine 6-phosphate synthetase [Nannizzia gypsea CBS 118893]|uniref:Glucosamine 6-phosphate synthetase n=1 Tax=Arthroderma gypseum (strain ATCC MYA-4604 / CBS 118893) TaxID=535722 RepID=E4UN37_ARTGP|nr:glucosamine 6-phosphate synthetase [Nannizzia gypsea CBS 118893]EFR00339.1 glucosamine 6-phosphate synthetase [Nannizzia gypsea CBS 118893]